MSRICKNCGNELEHNTMACSNCGVKKKKFPVFILIIIVIGIYALVSIIPSIIGMIGWISSFKTNDFALAYMKEKYGETFIYASPTGNSMTGTRKFLATCDSLPGETVLVQVENFRTVNRVYSDNYLAVKYQEETIEFFRDVALEHFNNAHVFYQPYTADAESSKLTANSSFEEHLADDEYEFIVMLELKASDVTSKQQIEKMASQIADNFGNLTLTVVMMNDEVYGTLDRNGINKCISRGKVVNVSTIYVVDSNIDEIDWKY